MFKKCFQKSTGDIEEEDIFVRLNQGLKKGQKEKEREEEYELQRVKMIDYLEEDKKKK